MSEIQNKFSYDALPNATASVVLGATERIRIRIHRAAEDIIAIGRDLIAVKKSLDHGLFGEWLSSEFEMTEMTAQRFMQVADRFEGKSNIMLDFKPTVLYLLAAPSTPDEVVEKAQAKDASGQKVTVADVKEWKDKIHNLKKRHNKQQGTLETKLATLEFDLQKRADRNAELTKELQKLRFQTSWEIENTNLEKETAARAEEISKLKEENRRLQESLHEARRPTPAPKPNSDDHSKPGNVEIFVPQQPPISQGKQLEILLEQVQQDLRQPSTEIPHQVLEAMRKELLGTVTVIEEAISRLTYQPSHLGENV